MFKVNMVFEIELDVEILRVSGFLGVVDRDSEKTGLFDFFINVFKTHFQIFIIHLILILIDIN